MVRAGDDLRVGRPGESPSPGQPIGPRRRCGWVGQQFRHQLGPLPDVPDRSVHRRCPAGLAQGWDVAGDDGRTTRQRLDHRQSEPLRPARDQDNPGLAVDLGQFRAREAVRRE